MMIRKCLVFILLTLISLSLSLSSRMSGGSLETVAAGEWLNLLDDLNQWSVNTDRGDTKMALSKAERGLIVDVASDGGEEDYPKVRRVFAQPQDWRPYALLRARLRVDCDDKSVRRKHIAFVFYDEQTRLPDYYPGRPLEQQPMKQQVISHWIPVGRWIDISDWLTTIHRATIRQIDLYIYELPPEVPHKYRWEVAKLQLERVGGETVAFDGQVFSLEQMKGAVGNPVGKVSTEDGLELVLGSAGEIASVRCKTELLGAAKRDYPTGLLLRDVTRNDPPVMVGGNIKQVGKEVRQSARLRGIDLAVNATYRSRGQYLEISGSVSDLRGEDRAVTVYFALPVAKAPWRWWDSMSKARTEPDEHGELSYLEKGMGFGLGGAHSKYPLGALTLPERGGLALAIRMDEPAVHRIAYNPRLQLFYIAFDFGLVPESRIDGRSLSEAPFRILLYLHDPAWGFRSALQRYYDFFPNFFTKRVKIEGSWYVWGDMSKTKGALEAGFAFHWGPGGLDAVKWDNANGALALLYIEPETYQQTMEDFERRPTFDEVMERFRKLVQGDEQEMAKVESLPYRVYPLAESEESVRKRIQNTAQVVMKSLNHDPDGKPYCIIGQFGWMRKSRWGAILSCNLSPRIPEGKGWFNRQKVIEPALRNAEKAGAHYDGIGLDSFGGYGQALCVNYRREHFRYSQFPLSFSALDHQPVQVAYFTTIEWLRELANNMHARGKVLMANCSWGSTPGWLTFAAPYLDIFGAEHPMFADPDFIRAIAYRKPCTDLPYNPRPDWEVAWHLLHDIYPGHGNDLNAMQRYAKLLRELSAAGWEPITGARVRPDHVRIERYGSGERIYLVIHNPSEQPTTAEVHLDTKVLGIKKFTAISQPGDRPLSAQGDSLSVPLSGRETLVILLRGR